MRPMQGSVALLGVAAAVACLVLAAQIPTGTAGLLQPSALLTVLGVHLGFFSELGPGSAAPGFPAGGDVQWLNSPPLDMRALRADGDWVLLHFWDSTSVESLRTLPAVKRMHEFYGPRGLRVVGVHRPRYGFARQAALVAGAVKRLQIKYPVVNDIDADVAHAYGVKKLDTMFLINADNIIVGRKSGQQASPSMLSAVCTSFVAEAPALACLPADDSSAESAQSAVRTRPARTPQHHGMHYYGTPRGPYAGPWCRAATADIFVGSKRVSDIDVGSTSGRGSLTSQQHYSQDRQRASFSDRAGLVLDDGAFVLSGDWTTHQEGMVAAANPDIGFVNSHLRLRYHAKEVFALMGLETLESGMLGAMCADGAQGSAPAGVPCEPGGCQDVGGDGSASDFGWCWASALDEHDVDQALHTLSRTLGRSQEHAAADGRRGRKLLAPGRSWGGCTPCDDKTLAPVKVYVLLDGEPVPSHLRGKDVEGDAFGRTFVRVVEPRVYFLIADVRAAARGLQLLPAAPGAALNQFSFSSDCDNALPPLV